MKWIAMSLGALSLAVCAVLGYRSLSRSRGNHRADTDDIDGGVVTRRWDDVPKEIESDEIVSFHCEISLFAVCDVDDLGHRVYKLDAVASEGLVTVKYSWRERDRKSGKGEYTAKNDFMARLQMIVAAHNLAKYNGYYHRVSGLPDMYGESLDITYASGESIYANDNQSGFLPIRAVRELIVHFGAATETENE